MGGNSAIDDLDVMNAVTKHSYWATLTNNIPLAESFVRRGSMYFFNECMIDNVLSETKIYDGRETMVRGITTVKGKTKVVEVVYDSLTEEIRRFRTVMHKNKNENEKLMAELADLKINPQTGSIHGDDMLETELYFLFDHDKSTPFNPHILRNERYVCETFNPVMMRN